MVCLPVAQATRTTTAKAHSRPTASQQQSNSKPTSPQQASTGWRQGGPNNNESRHAKLTATSQRRVGTVGGRQRGVHKPHLRDVLPQDLGLHGLRVPEVHGFIQELVDDDEVIPDRLLLQLPEVVLEHVHLCVQAVSSVGYCMCV